MRRLLPALLTGMLLLAGCSSLEADAASVTSAETSYAGASEAEQETQDVTLAETVLFDQEGIRITATGLSTGSLFGPELDLLVENDSAQNIVVQPNYCMVNGYMMDGLLYSDLAHHSHAVDTLTLLGSELEDNHIDTITDAELSLQITDADYYQTIDSTAPITLHF